MKHFWIWCVILILCASPAWAGKLDTVDKAPDVASSSSSGSNTASDILAETIIDVFFGALFSQRTAPRDTAGMPMHSEDAGNRGNLQGNSIQEVNANLRKGYSFALPNIRVDGSYFYDPDGVHAFHVKGEGGYLMIAADADYTRFYEGSSRLNNFATHGLIRVPLSTEFIQMDLALGYRRLWGNQVHQGFEFGIPFYLNFGRWVQVDLRGYVTFLGDSQPMRELDGGISGKYKFIGARAGYRYIKVKGADALQGPEVGLFFQW